MLLFLIWILLDLFSYVFLYLLSKFPPTPSTHQTKKEDSGTGVFQVFCEISKNTFFTEYLLATASETPPPDYSSLLSMTTFKTRPRHIKNSLSVYLFLDSEPQLGKSKESNNQGMKLQVKRAFKSYSFLLIKIQTDSAWNWPQLQILVCSNCLNPLLQNQCPLILLPPFSNPRTNIFSFNTHPSPWGLTSRKHPLIFL